ncbi:FHA domain-containing protein [Chondromyces apiculatus]|uniref:FHA domain-containing protein n=1 Tax=Chondromyces apiculatus DSM 436 TaxID=1192034 RepID=A0A017T4W6_9BACT|nr:FHA domain-containing protein [Chondromyces apiculatus]EYF04313.1 Hypothetical protein CAP_4577 [Chondromyces apiculatus DSM 436]
MHLPDAVRPTLPPDRRQTGRSRLGLFPLAAALLVLVSLFTRDAVAAPEARLLRIDPRASTVDGAPILTSVVDLVQNKRLSDITKQCAAITGDAHYDCVADALEQPQALYSSFDFPEKNALFTVTVDGTDLPSNFESKARWGDSASQPGVGTAWLILIDAASTMGARFDEAKAVASAFINTMTPNDIVDVMFFNDRGVVEDSKWVSQKQQALQSIGSIARTYPTQGRTRPLLNIIKTAATDAFRDLGNVGQGVPVPMHQAMVLLSNGGAGSDPNSTGPAAMILRDYLSKGRFPENNDVLPKTPVPVVSIWFPSKLIEEFNLTAREFMEGLANPEMGGFFTIVRDGQTRRAANIVNSVRTRFNRMHIVRWRVSCIAPSITQTFKLAFVNTNPVIAGDATFQNVPVGIDPTTWPLDIDREATERAAQKSPAYPGGSIKIFGNFCWGGNAQRAEIYMVPKNQAAPQSLQGGGIDDAKKAQRSLIEQGMRGKALSTGDTVAEFELPSSDNFLVGKGEAMSGRIILYDNQARRTSAITADKILTVKAQETPLPYLLIGGITFGGVVLVLLVVSIVRGGGGGGKRRGAQTAAPPPKPIVAGMGGPPAPMGGPAPFGPPMPAGGDFGGYGGPPPGGASRAILSGASGIFTVTPGMEMRAGRDGSACQILLTEPRVSGIHAVVKVEGGQLLVRDENSNNGTFLNGQRLPAGVWTPVSAGAVLRFGPVEFSTRLE